MDLSSNPTGKYGGSIKEAGGSLGSYTSAKEEAYFKQQDQKLIQELQEKKKETASKSDSNKNMKR